MGVRWAEQDTYWEKIVCTKFCYSEEILESNGILYWKLFWPTVRKKCNLEKLLQFMSLKTENLQNFRDHNFILAAKGQSFSFWNKIRFNLLLFLDLINRKNWNTNWNKWFVCSALQQVWKTLIRLKIRNFLKKESSFLVTTQFYLLSSLQKKSLLCVY